MFFFEKKNQKTFPRLQLALSGAQTGKVLLLLFLQKRKNPC